MLILCFITVKLFIGTLEHVMQGFAAGQVVQRLTPAVWSQTPWLVMSPSASSHLGHSWQHTVVIVSASAAINLAVECTAACQVFACKCQTTQASIPRAPEI